MTGAPVAAGLLLGALGLALGFVPPRRAAIAAGMAALLTLALVVAARGMTPGIALAGCWISLLATCALVFWPAPLARLAGAPVIAGANAGLWAGLVLSNEASSQAVFAAMAALLLAVPAALCVRRGWTVAPRVVASWLLAVALLVGSIPYLVDHPGYVPDHRM